MANFDVVYQGPKAEIATLTGSPLWGITYQEVAEAYIKRGWKYVMELRPETPWGQGPVVQHFETRDGRSVIRIPSYGMVEGKDWNDGIEMNKVFWVLWKAGAKVLLVGGTSGIADWRLTEDKIVPGDIVLPWSFRTSDRHRGLPGTEHETAWPKHDLTLEDPFCTELANTLADAAREQVEKGLLRRLHTTQDARVALVVPDGITFETDYDIMMWSVLNKMMSEMFPGPAVVSLHGDCINPVLARLLGMHVAYYHMVANVAQGLPMDESITESLYRLYLGNFAAAGLEMEFQLLTEMQVPNGNHCSCIKALHTAPEVFSKAMTQGGQ